MTNIFEELQIILHGLWQRRWVALAVAWGVCLLGWLAVSLIPNVYKSHARVFVQSQNMLPSAAATPLDMQKAIDQVRQTMTSVAVLERVVRITDLGKGASDAEVAAKAAMLRANLQVVSQQDNLFEITATSSDKSLSGAENGRIAAQVAAGLIRAFQETSLAGGKEETSQSLKFLDQQIAEQARALDAAEQRRVDFEQRNGTGLRGGGTIQDRMAAMRSELAQIDSQLLSAQSALAGINGQLAATAPEIVTGGVGGGGNAALAQAEAQLAQARANGWTDSHPDVQALKRQIETLRRLGNGAGSGSTRSANPAYVSLRSIQAERSATVSALQARKGQIQGELAAIAQRQVQNPGLVAEQDRLNRDYDAVKQQYDKLVSDRESVRLRGDAQSEGGAVQFRVIDPPTMSSNPASPNRPLLLFGVLVAGVGAGIGAAFALGQIRTTYATTGRLERATGLPVIGGISEVQTPARLELGRRQTRWFYAGCGGLAGLCFLLLAVEYIQRGMSA